MTQEGNANSEEAGLRPISCELNPLSRSDGSALLSQGGTCVLASMAGPLEVKTQNLKIDKAFVECIYRPRSGIPTVQDKLREHNIREACESALLTSLHPRTMITIQLQELQDRGGLEACAVNAACLALLISGIPMKFTIAAMTCIIDKDHKIILDPDHCQAFEKRASLTFVFESLNKNLVMITNTGIFSIEEFNEAERICRAASDHIFDFYRKTITKFHKESLLNNTDCPTERIEPMES